MLKNAKAFSSYAVKDLKKARKFYEDTLELKVTSKMEEEIDLNIGGHRVMIYNKPNYVPATYTVLNFLVKDVEKTVDALNKKGVKMEQYKGFGQDKKGISREWGFAIAWFTDPAGNIIALMEDRGK